MKIFITGATGFIGRALILRLRRDGHHITALVRDPIRARALLGLEATLLEDNGDEAAFNAAVRASGAVVNLAGEPILGGRWTDAKRKALRSSRIRTTSRIVKALSGDGKKPTVLVSASAVGIYGDRGDELLPETAREGDDFLASLCRDWEQAAAPAADAGVRVAIMRIGVVLGLGGGALDQMLTPFRMGVGGPVGSGRQFVPWIHIDDLVDLFTAAISQPEYEGTFNATAPEPVPFKTLAKAIGRVLNRPAVLPVPSFAVKAIFGEASAVLLQGQRAIPARATSLGFTHRFRTVESALHDLLANESVSIGSATDIPDSEYLKKRKPAYLLSARTEIDRPLDEVFRFFSRAENLGLITPPAMQFRITKSPNTMEPGALIHYSLRVGPVPIRWTTRIDVWDEGVRFVDSQLRGPYACWYHEHAFRTENGRTIMTDRVWYAPPAGPLGRIANAVFVADELKRVFGYRASILRLRFGAESTPWV